MGDILELRWEIMAMDAELDFFVTSCYAEAAVRGGGEKLQLIENGFVFCREEKCSDVRLQPWPRS